MGEVYAGDYDVRVNSGGGEEGEMVHEWENGLPNGEDLMPLNRGLIPPELPSEFDIRHETYRTFDDVDRASKKTITALRGSNFKPSASRRNESSSSPDEAESTPTKKQRLAWTPVLHKRFVDVVAHLGIKNTVPKTIMKLMNVEGLTRESVASHLQKYRLYLKR